MPWAIGWFNLTGWKGVTVKPVVVWGESEQQHDKTRTDILALLYMQTYIYQWCDSKCSEWISIQAHSHHSAIVLLMFVSAYLCNTRAEERYDTRACMFCHAVSLPLMTNFFFRIAEEPCSALESSLSICTGQFTVHTERTGVGTTPTHFWSTVSLLGCCTVSDSSDYFMLGNYLTCPQHQCKVSPDVHTSVLDIEFNMVKLIYPGCNRCLLSFTNPTGAKIYLMKQPKWCKPSSFITQLLL